MDQQRPNPEQILEKIQRSEEKERRGRLKIFFGACAGVGKTHAMLTAAQTLRAQNVNVVIGLVETHGRHETDALLEGFSVIPPQHIAYREKILREFNLDATLALHPAVVLVDELAHSNVKGSRHEKRWQDIEELLDAGIDVYTTLNVQHIESLNDIIAHITTIRIHETVPDTIFDKADEVVLVDLPPDELLQRLHQGKIYLISQVHHAVKNFFRKGNLIALREIALRRMADRVDVQMREYRTDEDIQRIWQAKDLLLVCIGPKKTNEKLVRKAYRMANALRANWIAIYIETPKLQKLSDKERRKILNNLKLAHELGAETKILSGTHRAETIVSYARSHNVTKIMIEKSQRPRWQHLFHQTLADQITDLISDIDVFVVGYEKESGVINEPTRAAPMGLEFGEIPSKKQFGYIWAALICALITGSSFILVHYISLVNMIMLYLVGVLITAWKLGRGPSIFLSFISVAAFDFFFVPPRLTFVVNDTEYIVTFIIMLATGLIISSLTTNLRYQAQVAIYRERRTNAISTLSKDLSTALTASQIIEISSRHVFNEFQAKVSFFLPDLKNKVHLKIIHIPPEIAITDADEVIAQWVFDHHLPAGFGTQTLAANKILYLPLNAPMATRGVLAVLPTHLPTLSLPEQLRLLDTFVTQIALSLEHIHYVEVAKNALLTMEIERLRNAILDDLSNELSKPLQSIMHLLDKLTIEKESSPEKHQRRMFTLSGHIRELRQLTNNLMDMSRLQAEKVALNKREINLATVIQAALEICKIFLQQHQLIMDLPADLPLVNADPVLLERVFYQLLENAQKFTPTGSQIIISTEQREQKIWMSVQDNGPGIPAGMEEKIFEKFTHGDKTAKKEGFGLGLAICRAIIEAHDGEIFAENVIPHGARFYFWLPLE